VEEAHGEAPLNCFWFLSAMRARAPAILVTGAVLMNLFSRLNSEDVAAAFVNDAVTAALRMPEGVERDRLLRSADRDKVRLSLHTWANSSGLQGPT